MHIHCITIITPNNSHFHNASIACLKLSHTIHGCRLHANSQRAILITASSDSTRWDKWTGGRFYQSTWTDWHFFCYYLLCLKNKHVIINSYANVVLVGDSLQFIAVLYWRNFIYCFFNLRRPLAYFCMAKMFRIPFGFEKPKTRDVLNEMHVSGSVIILSSM